MGVNDSKEKQVSGFLTKLEVEKHLLDVVKANNHLGATVQDKIKPSSASAKNVRKVSENKD